MDHKRLLCHILQWKEQGGASERETDRDRDRDVRRRRKRVRLHLRTSFRRERKSVVPGS